MRKVERRISHLQTQHFISGRDFCKSSANRGAEAHHRKHTRVLHPQYLRDDAQLADSNRLSWALFLPSVVRRFWTPSKTDVTMTQGRRRFRGKGKQTTLQTEKETWKQAIWVSSLNFPLNAFPICDLWLSEEKSKESTHSFLNKC